LRQSLEKARLISRIKSHQAKTAAARRNV
jgi:hypothetical protein